MFRFKVIVTDLDDKQTEYLCCALDVDPYFKKGKRIPEMDDIILTAQNGDYIGMKVSTIKTMTIEYNGDGFTN